MKIALFVLSLFTSSLLTAQNWQFAARTGGLHHLVPDDNDQVLFIGRVLHTIMDTLNTQGICKWDGENVSTVNNQVLPSGLPGMGSTKLAFFNGNLYYTGYNTSPNGITSFELDPISPASTIPGHYFLRFNGSIWENIQLSINGRILCLSVVENELWAIERRTGYDTPFRFVRILQDGQIIETTIEAEQSPYLIQSYGDYTAFARYNDSFYLGSRGTGTLLIPRLLKWNGANSFEPIDLWIDPGGHTAIEALTVFQGKLIVAGKFSTLAGAPANNIAAWDGENWEPLFGSGTDARVNNLVVHNNVLYFSGDFTEMTADGVTIGAHRIGWYNGNTAGALSNDIFNGTVRTITFFQDTLYAGGSFHAINFDQHYSFAKFIGQLPLSITSVNENFSDIQLKVFPNPFNDQVNIKYEFIKSGRIEIYNLNGKFIFNEEINNKEVSVINGNKFGNAGIYIIKIIPENGIPTNTKILYIP